MGGSVRLPLRFVALMRSVWGVSILRTPISEETWGTRREQAPPIHKSAYGCGTPVSGETQLWSEEVAKLLIEHDKVCTASIFFIGIACPKAFAGDQLGSYCPLPDARHFPLVGPNEIAGLASYWTWSIPKNLHQHKVTVAQAKANIDVLGGQIEKQTSGTSHIRVDFGKGRGTWTLGTNDDPQEDSRIAQIEPLCGKPFEFVKYALLYGKEPLLVGRFDGRIGC